MPARVSPSSSVRNSGGSKSSVVERIDDELEHPQRDDERDPDQQPGDDVFFIGGNKKKTADCRRLRGPMVSVGVLTGVFFSAWLRSWFRSWLRSGFRLAAVFVSLSLRIAPSLLRLDLGFASSVSCALEIGRTARAFSWNRRRECSGIFPAAGGISSAAHQQLLQVVFVVAAARRRYS